VSDQRSIDAVRHVGHVLVVEDNPDVAEVTCGLLEDLGYEVAVVSNASSALEFLRTQITNIDIVLTDIVMPGSANGIDLARSLRRDLDGKIAVVLASGYSDQAQKAADEGFVMLRKPYDSKALQDAIDDARRQAVRVKVS
jgi:two-component system NtrC family sensor kinase